MAAGRVVSIHITADKGGELRAVDRVELVAGCGVRGNRQFQDDAPAKRQLTLVSVEDIAAVNDATGLALLPEWTRRNVVTEGIDLSSLIGKRFAVGAALAVGIESCRPCEPMTNRLESESRTGSLRAADVLAAMADRGGLRAEILRDGELRAGDTLTEEDDDA